MSDHAAGWSAKPWPFLLGAGGGVLLPWAFILQLVYGFSLMALITLSVVNSIIFIGLIGWLLPGVRNNSEFSSVWPYRSTAVFIALQSFIGLSIVALYWYLRSGMDVWPPSGSPDMSSPVISMFLLFASSITAVLAGKASRQGDVGYLINWYLVTALFWIVYAVIMIVSWIELSGAGYAMGTNLFTLSFYCVSGVHFAHLLFGLVLIGLSIVYTFKQGHNFSRDRSLLMFVHFVNAFGIWGLPQLFL